MTLWQNVQLVPKLLTQSRFDCMYLLFQMSDTRKVNLLEQIPKPPNYDLKGEIGSSKTLNYHFPGKDFNTAELHFCHRPLKIAVYLKIVYSFILNFRNFQGVIIPIQETQTLILKTFKF